MNLRERYKSKSKKRLSRFVLFYSFISLILIFYSSFARYTTITEGTQTAEIANWKIKINGTNISNNETLSKIITLVPDSTNQTTKDNKIAPGKSGYFDIIINPEGTDVSIEYTITIGTTNLPSGITLTNYEIVETSISQTLTDNIITGEIALADTTQQLTSSDTKTIRIYWSWDENDTTIPDETTSYNIMATAKVQQKI